MQMLRVDAVLVDVVQDVFTLRTAVVGNLPLEQCSDVLLRQRGWLLMRAPVLLARLCFLRL